MFMEFMTALSLSEAVDGVSVEMCARSPWNLPRKHSLKTIASVRVKTRDSPRDTFPLWRRGLLISSRTVPWRELDRSDQHFCPSEPKKQAMEMSILKWLYQTQNPNKMSKKKTDRQIYWLLKATGDPRLLPSIIQKLLSLNLVKSTVLRFGRFAATYWGIIN